MYRKLFARAAEVLSIHLSILLYRSHFETMLGAGALGRPRGMVWGGRREEGSGWGTHVYLWQIHFDIWQNQYNIIKLNKIKFKKQTNKQKLLVDEDSALALRTVHIIKESKGFIHMRTFVERSYLYLSIYYICSE